MQSPSTAVTVDEPVTPGRESLVQVEVEPTSPPAHRFLGGRRGLLLLAAIEQIDEGVAQHVGHRDDGAGHAADPAEADPAEAAEHAARGRAARALLLGAILAATVLGRRMTRQGRQQEQRRRQ
jgi:hypothetical protein